MSTFIRIGLIVVAVVAVVALLSPIISELVDSMPELSAAVGPLISQLSSYFAFGRALLNALIGYPALVDVCLYLAIGAPFTLVLVKFGIMIYSKIVG